MKRCSSGAQLATVFAMVLLAAHGVFAQVPLAGSGTGINVAFVKLFGPVSAFTAKVETRVIDPYQQVVVRMPMDFAALDNKVRLEINLAQIQSRDFSATDLDKLKQAGLDRLVSVFRPDKKATYVIYPGVQSYQEVVLVQGEAEAFEKGLKLQKTSLGKETIDGHACVKNKAIVSNAKGPVFEALTWNATDLKDFPLRIEMKEKVNTISMRFSQVRFVKPDAKQFDLPAGYSRMPTGSSPKK
jgi:hypothetical protein